MHVYHSIPSLDRRIFHEKSLLLNTRSECVERQSPLYTRDQTKKNSSLMNATNPMTDKTIPFIRRGISEKPATKPGRLLITLMCIHDRSASQYEITLAKYRRLII